MKQGISLFLPLVLCFSLCADQAEVLKKLVDESSQSEQKKQKYEGDSIAYNLWDSTVNGAKGGLFALIATPCSLGLYTPYAWLKLGDLAIKRSILCGSNAAQFRNKSRKELEKETEMRELTNRLAKATVSSGVTAAVVVLLAAFAKGL